MGKIVPPIKIFFSIFIFIALFGCASAPHRPYIDLVSLKNNCKKAPPNADPDLITPDTKNSSYTLHFLEFDDQGWPYPESKNGDDHWSPGLQIDCAIDDLAQKLKEGDVRAFVFVHGWHHSAENNDRDLNRFRDLLQAQAQEDKRQVVGFYVGWNGASLKIPYVKDLTFWGRKNAAHHVAEGSVREFFARIKALRNHYNRRNNERSRNCGKPESLTAGKDCPLRTVMIGHSFGAWVLYSSTAPYILETLAGKEDLPSDAKIPVTARERGIADLILLLNPAFEASRYEPVHRAAQRYRPETYESPLLVSVTSVGDGATRYAFPIARFFNTIFQYPATTDEESKAMRNTHGHLNSYLTHELSVDPLLLEEHKRTECSRQEMREKFFQSATRPSGQLKFDLTWERRMCGGLVLRSLGHPKFEPYSIVWNIRASKDVIPDHNAIITDALDSFIVQIYGDIRRAPDHVIMR